MAKKSKKRIEGKNKMKTRTATIHQINTKFKSLNSYQRDVIKEFISKSYSIEIGDTLSLTYNDVQLIGSFLKKFIK